MRKQIIINGLLVNYYQFGSLAAGLPAIIFLHGWRSESEVWAPVISRLPEGKFATFCLDLPGFGGSEPPRPDFSLQDYCDVVEIFIRKLNVGKTCLLGHSFGGRVAMKLAATKTDIISKLVLVDSAGFKIETIFLKFKKLAARVFNPIFNLPLVKFLKPHFFKIVASEDFLAAPENLRPVFIRIISEDLTSLLGQIKAETLILWGERDYETPLNFAYKLKENIKKVHLEILKDAGHFSFLDKSDEFAGILNRFLNDTA